MKRKVMSKSNRIFYIVNTVLLMICLLLVAMPILPALLHVERVPNRRRFELLPARGGDEDETEGRGWCLILWLRIATSAARG